MRAGMSPVVRPSRAADLPAIAAIYATLKAPDHRGFSFAGGDPASSPLLVLPS
jgi:hypothetical protein